MTDKRDPVKLERALIAFTNTIDATGGVSLDERGNCVPTIDEDWIDLGEAYVQACEALGTPIQPREG